MRDSDCGSALPDEGTTPKDLAARLAALAREARLLEFALKGDSDDSRTLATELEHALESAMDAESPDEISQACAALENALGEVVNRGMQLTAEMTEMEVDGVLGRARLPVLTAVLTTGA
jgi:DNA repair ATPase RecN